MIMEVVNAMLRLLLSRPAYYEEEIQSDFISEEMHENNDEKPSIWLTKYYKESLFKKKTRLIYLQI